MLMQNRYIAPVAGVTNHVWNKAIDLAKEMDMSIRAENKDAEPWNQEQVEEVASMLLDKLIDLAIEQSMSAFVKADNNEFVEMFANMKVILRKAVENESSITDAIDEWLTNKRSKQ